LKALGRHILLELLGCDPGALNDLQGLEDAFTAAARESNATVLKTTFHQFNPHGVSGVVIISESHLTVHTWPEYGYAAVDIFSCGERMDVGRATEFLTHKLAAKHASSFEVKRGLVY
jgi:S-adenosylmethionine decarboxylase proenzyme